MELFTQEFRFTNAIEPKVLIFRILYKRIVIEIEDFATSKTISIEVSEKDGRRIARCFEDSLSIISENPYE